MTEETLVLSVVWLGLTLYALLGGADFGAGIWEVLTALRAPADERRLVHAAIGPVWEANHVWLIFVLVVLWTSFPGAFTSLVQALWVPLLLALVGIVFRGAAFAYRSYGAGASRQETLWGAAFAVASALAPLSLGAAAGAVAAWPRGVAADGSFSGDFLLGWLHPTSIFTALLATGACAYLAAVFLVREAAVAGDAALVETWRRRALGTGVWMGVLAAAGLGVVATDAPVLWEGFRARGTPFVVASAVCGVASLVLLWRGRSTAATVTSAAAVAAVVVGWGAAQFAPGSPPADLLLASAAPRNVLRAVLWTVAAGAVVLLPSLAFLFRVFKGRDRGPARGG